MIKGILIINNHGKPRLVKFYQCKFSLCPFDWIQNEQSWVLLESISYTVALFSLSPLSPQPSKVKRSSRPSFEESTSKCVNDQTPFAITWKEPFLNGETTSSSYTGTTQRSISFLQCKLFSCPCMSLFLCLPLHVILLPHKVTHNTSHHWITINSSFVWYTRVSFATNKIWCLFRYTNYLFWIVIRHFFHFFHAYAFTGFPRVRSWNLGSYTSIRGEVRFAFPIFTWRVYFLNTHTYYIIHSFSFYLCLAN